MFLGLQKQIQAVMQFWQGKPVTLTIVLVGVIVAVLRLEAVELPPTLEPAPAPTELPKSPAPTPQPERPQVPPLERGELLTEANIRYRPTVASQVQAVGQRGDQVTILTQTAGLDDAYQWYLVRLPNSAVEGWVRGDLLQVASPASLPPSSRPPSSRPPSSNRESSGQQRDWPRGGDRYSREAVQYFQEVAFGNEFGSSQSRRIRKWTGEVLVRVHGNPTKADRDTLSQVVAELNRLIGRHGSQVQLTLVDERSPEKANLDIYFVPHPEFPDYEPNYQPGNLGFAYVNWAQDRIYQGRVLISTVDISQQERAHLIREELTQAMGLLQDSERYDDSIFYQGWTSSTQYTDLDKAVIEMLYYPSVEPGMDERSAIAALNAPPSDDPSRGPVNFLLPMGRYLFNQLKRW